MNFSGKFFGNNSGKFLRILELFKHAPWEYFFLGIFLTTPLIPLDFVWQLFWKRNWFRLAFRLLLKTPTAFIFEICICFWNLSGRSYGMFFTISAISVGVLPVIPLVVYLVIILVFFMFSFLIYLAGFLKILHSVRSYISLVFS